MSTDGPGTSILKSLNDAQRRAVTSNAATVAILAGPGSGKTHTLTSRVAWLIRQAGFQPSDIVVATFTVKAAREMKARIGKALGEDTDKKIVIGTFHSIARRYLAKYGTRVGLDPKFGIADDGDSKAIIQRICKRLDLKIEPSYAKSWISKRKAKGSAPAPARKHPDPPDLLTCFKEYQDHLERSNLLDYDDLLVRCVELLRQHASCVSNVQAVLIDEYQDTNGIQYDLMKLFAQARQRITVVGDPDQSIYGWRSAEIRNLYRLLRDYPETAEVSLEENYRSSQSILDISLQVIQQDEMRYQKVLVPVHTKGAKPVLRKLKSSAAEGEWIVTELRRVVMLSGGMIKYEDVAILLRSASLSRHVESALGKAGVSYRMIGGHKFYDRKEIKILLDYLRVVYQPDNNDAVARVINVPRRGIGDATIKSLLEEAEQAQMSVWSLLCKHCRGQRKATTNIRPKMEQKLNTELLKIVSSLRQKASQMTESSPITLVDLLDDLVGQLRFKNYLEEEYEDDHEGRWANVQELVSLAADFTRDLGKVDEDALPDIDNVEQSKDDDVLGRFLANIALASDAQKDDKSQDTSAMVTISTIHAAKGLEWPVVFVPSVYTGSIPHSRAEDSDEERRLLYVAMTRAQALLYLSCPLYGSQGLSNKVELSPFVSPFTTRFAQKGPSFDKPVVDAAAAILGRAAPTQQVIFDKLPPMFSPEDDLFPIEPYDPKNTDGFDDDPKGHYARAPKRQRTGHSNGGGDNEEEGEEHPWKPDYATTMERSSEFTMSSLPGFVSAGAHQSALSAAAASVTSARDAGASRKQSRTGTTRRQADQRSLLGFMTTEPKAPAHPLAKKNPNDLSLMRYQAAASRHTAKTAPVMTPVTAPKPAIDPTFAEHKLPGARALAPPRLGGRTDSEKRKQYACFSSPPPRAPTPEEDKAAKPVPEPEPVRPAASFHATTFMSVKPRAGVRRPVGMGPAPSMDRLRKPFKPLTINRPKGPGG
ncbi:DNA helicase, UvrD/REP type [Purpureocillium lavendulum]|uniref:DNA 3'-5' helicase n=1 Tax=Purpureocillium lavendulum TaxID=1247861 RepID=A0AB34FSJ5_9HYPO|nr:DNA helicase, UvrD/REP type [Purpureocillium lavendulum]